MKKHYFICIFFLLLFSCSKNYLTDINKAETYINNNQKQEAYKIYNSLLLNVSDSKKVKHLNDSEYSDLINNIFNSIEKNIPDNEERLSFFIGYIKNNSFDNFYKKTRLVLYYFINHQDTSINLKENFIHNYIDIMHNKVDLSSDRVQFEGLINYIYNSILSDDKIIEIVSFLFEYIDKEKFLTNQNFPTSIYATNNPLNNKFESLIEKHLHKKILVKTTQGVFQELTGNDKDKDKEIFLDLNKYKLDYQENIEFKNLIPVNLYESDGRFSDIEYNVSPLYYLIPKNKRPDAAENVEQIVFLKSINLLSGFYHDNDFTKQKNAYQKLIGLYVYDIKKDKMLIAKTFIGSKPPEEINENDKDSILANYGDTPLNDVLNYLNGKNSGQVLESDLEQSLKIINKLMFKDIL